MLVDNKTRKMMWKIMKMTISPVNEFSVPGSVRQVEGYNEFPISREI